MKSKFKHWLLVLSFVVAASPATAQQEHSTGWRTKPADADARTRDGTEAARTLVDYGRCVADRRHEQARTAVLAPLGSPEQTQALSRVIFRGEDPCLRGGFEELQMRMGSQTLAGGLAQALVLRDYPDFPHLVAQHRASSAGAAIARVTVSATEAFGRCFVEGDPASAFQLVASRPGSEEERAAIRRLRDHLGPCLTAGTTLSLTPLFLRNIGGVAAYRLAHQISPRSGVGSSTR